MVMIIFVVSLIGIFLVVTYVQPCQQQIANICTGPDEMGTTFQAKGEWRYGV
jgi:hypothetical protein